MRNQRYFSHRSADERAAMHGQMRQMARGNDCENDNERPWDAHMARAVSNWCDSRADEPAFAPYVAAFRNQVAQWRQANRPHAV